MVATINALCAVIVGLCPTIHESKIQHRNCFRQRPKPTIAAEIAAIVATFSFLLRTLGEDSNVATRAAIFPDGIPGAVRGWLRVFAFRRSRR